MIQLGCWTAARVRAIAWFARALILTLPDPVAMGGRGPGPVDSPPAMGFASVGFLAGFCPLIMSRAVAPSDQPLRPATATRAPPPARMSRPGFRLIFLSLSSDLLGGCCHLHIGSDLRHGLPRPNALRRTNCSWT